MNNTLSVAYLAPEIPALSATFVYEEIYALASRGIRTTVFSVHKPSSIATNHQELVSRTHYLYGEGKVRGAFAALGYVRLNSRFSNALGFLLKDIKTVGVFSIAALSLSFQFLMALKLANLLRVSRCTHLHVHFAHVPTQIAMYAATISGVPFTIVGHANDIFQRPLLLRGKGQRAKQFITISEYNRQHLQKLGVPSSKLSVIRCGVSFEVKSAVTPWRIRPAFRLGSIGRLIEKKGFDVLLRAVALLKERNCSFTLSIAGDGPLKQELIDLSKQLSITDCVVFLGVMPHGEVAEWMESLDLFVLACKQDSQGDKDGIPVVLMEAMARGVPVISTHISGIPELVVHGETGLLAKCDDHLDLAEKIQSLLSSSELTNRLIKNASQHVSHEFGMETNVTRLINHIEAK